MHGVKVNRIISQRIVLLYKRCGRPSGRPTAGLWPSPRAFPSGMLSRDLCRSSTPRRSSDRNRVFSSLVVVESYSVTKRQVNSSGPVPLLSLRTLSRKVQWKVCFWGVSRLKNISYEEEVAGSARWLYKLIMIFFYC